MKILINEKQYKNILSESTEGLDEVITTIKKTYNIDDEFLSKIKDFIVNSECKKITFENIRMGEGVSLNDRVILSPMNLKKTLSDFLFVLFHEIAHQYQLKKYGAEKMFECYIGEMSIIDAATLMKKIEMVADDFAYRKLRELVKLGFLKQSDINQTGYAKNVPLGALVQMINNIKSMFKKEEFKDIQKMSEKFYNLVKSEL